MVDQITYSKIINFLKDIQQEHNFLITEIVLNNEQMNLLVEDHKALKKYDSTYCPGEDINENELSFTWKYGKIKLKRWANNG